MSNYKMHSLSSNSVPTTISNISNLLQLRISHTHLLQLHAQVIASGAHQNNLIATRLIGRYPSELALRVFHQLKSPNIFPFNAIIRILSEHNLSPQAFVLLRDMKRCSLCPNDFTFSFVLKACLRGSDPQFVKQVHADAVKLGFLEDPSVCDALLNVYAKGVKNLYFARKLFDEMPDKSRESSWTALISGFAQSGKPDEALKLFLLMVEEKLRLDSDAMVNILSACARLAAGEVERWIIDLEGNVRGGSLDSHWNDSVNTVLIYLYGKRGNVEMSRESFDKISNGGKRNVVPWNAVISACVQNGCPGEALSVFRLMMECEYVTPNHVTMVSVLSACSRIGDIDLGMQVHEYLESHGRKDILKTNSFLATALIDMYSKCGNLRHAKEVFDRMVSKDVVSVNAMIMGLAVNGVGDEALRLFSESKEIGFRPNAGTFLGVLYACSHSGMLDKGRQIFRDMNTHFYTKPQLEHYACYIDLLARVGLIEEALEVVNSMPFKPNNFVWGALLGGCLRHSRAELTQYISKRLVEVDPESSAGYVMLSNAFALDHQWSEVSGLRWSMRDKGVKKQPGCSWISIDGAVHEFLAGFSSHPELEKVCCMLDGLVREIKMTSSSSI